MTDFRTELYRRYVSKFKAETGVPEGAGLRAHLRWCEMKYLPLLQDLRPDSAILELGCGPGNMLGLLAAHGYTDVRGIDISAEQVEVARSRGHAAEVADVFDYLQSASGRFDAILAIDFFEHFSKEELLRLAAALHDALGPDGLLMLQTPNGAGLFPHSIVYGDLTHLTILTPGSLQQLLWLSGFDRFVFRETGPVPKNLSGRLRLAAWSLIKATANLVRRVETGQGQRLWTENMICSCRREP